MALDNEELEKDHVWKHKVSCSGLGVASLLLFVRIIVDISTIGLENPSLIGTIIALLIVFGLYDYSKRSGKYEGPVFCTLSLCLLIIAYRSEMTGGLNSPYVSWLPVLPIFAFFMLSIRASFIVLLISTLSLCSVSYEFLGNFINTNYPTPPLFTRMFSILFIILIAAAITHIYERKRKKMVKDLALEKVKVANASKLSDLGEMASSIAHEINNPLTVILARSNNLTKNINNKFPDLEKIAKEIDQINRMSQRIAKIVKAMKTLSNDHKRMDNSYQTFENLFEDVLILTSNKIKLQNISFTFINEIEEITSDIFPMQLGQVFLNIINNSCDAIENNENKWIEVKLQEYSDNKILFTFLDSGKGIPKESRDQLFTPFYSSKEIGRGTRLRLSVSKSIVESFGGVFRLNNNRENTCFEVVLPRKFTIDKVA